jgi:integrase/recombinase XerD
MLFPRKSFGWELVMKQAKTLNDRELRNLLTLVSRRRYALRDRNMLLLTHWAGMRIGEVAALLTGDVAGRNGEIVEEINLKPHQTKGKHSRTVVLSTRMRTELQQYLLSRFGVTSLTQIADGELAKPLFATQMRAGFTANTACYHFFMLYREAGFTGASSHSGRRSFLTKLSAKSVPLKTMMELAGHRQAQTTMRYVSVTPDMKRAAVELL